MQELLSIIKGKVLAISMKHDASRVVQTAIQFGSPEVLICGRTVNSGGGVLGFAGTCLAMWCVVLQDLSMRQSTAPSSA